MIEYLHLARPVRANLAERAKKSHKSVPLYGALSFSSLHDNRLSYLLRNKYRRHLIHDCMRALSVFSESSRFLLDKKSSNFKKSRLTSIPISCSIFVCDLSPKAFLTKSGNILQPKVAFTQKALHASAVFETPFEKEVCFFRNRFKKNRTRSRACNVYASSRDEFFQKTCAYNIFQMQDSFFPELKPFSPSCHFAQIQNCSLQSNRKSILLRATNPRFAPLDQFRNAFHLPDLLDIQRCGYNKFIQDGIPYLLSQISPIQITSQEILIELVLNNSNFQLLAPDESPRDCVLNMTTHSCKLFVEAKIVYKTLSDRILLQTKSEWVLIGHLPIMTKRGHFVINGSPRVIVHQAVRSPGIYFQQVIERDENKILRFYGDIIPRRGVWLRLQTTPRGRVEAKLKKGKKLSAYMLKRCLECLERIERQSFKEKLLQKLTSQSPKKPNRALSLGKILPSHLQSLDSSVFSKMEKSHSLVSAQSFEKRNSLFSKDFVFDADLTDFLFASEEKALLYAYNKLYRPVEEKEKEEIVKKGKNASLFKNFVVDKRFESKKCYTNLFSTFKDKSRYDLSDLGRQRINSKFGISVSKNQLSAADIYAVSNWLEKLSKGKRSVDDIDHFQNRRIRTSGELLYTQFENGLDRLKRFALNKLKEFVQSSSHTQALAELHLYSHTTPQTALRPVLHQREDRKMQYAKMRDIMKTVSADELALHQKILRDPAPQRKEKHAFGMPFPEIDPFLKTQSKLLRISIRDLFSTKAVNGALRELFGINPLSQYMDQTNPLAETTHKRRLSSLGIGGVSRESAGMAIRGIHPTHYGRICPIETPEGKNAGLVNSLAFYTKINDKGFLETPYYKVVNGQVQDELGFTFFSAKSESIAHLKIAPSDLQKSWNNILAGDHVPVRVADNILDLFQSIPSRQVDCIGISPVQMISVATSLIPFLEHNDANRALMGSNMQRQAVPLMIPEAPIVGTGLESLVLAESGHLIQAKTTGFTSYVSSNKIVVEYLFCSDRNRIEFLSQRNRPNTDSQMKRKYIFQSQADTKKDIKTLPISPLSTKSISLYPSVYSFRGKKTQVRAPYIFFPLLKRYDLSKNNNKRIEKGDISFSKSSHLLDRHKTYSSKKSRQGTISRQKRKEIVKNATFFSFIKNKKIYTRKESYVKSNTHKNLKSSTPIQVCLNNFFRNEKTHSFLPVSIPSSHQLLLEKDLLSNFDCGYFCLNTSNLSKNQRFLPFEHLLNNFDRSNQDTCLIQRALVKEGDWVQKGDILTDCSASDQGQLAVGKNILVAYIPWEGYNFEDAIVISERLVKEDVYTSLHIERYELSAQEIREASEWFTKDLPGVPPEKLAHLDRFGLPKIGSFVKEGDILVGKMRYSNKKATTAYERLLCDIIGENNFSARDSSLYVPKGVHARVIKHKIVTFFENESQDRDKGKQGKSPKQVHIFLGEKRAIQIGDKMSGRHGNKGVVATILPRQDMPYLADGTPIDIILNPLGVPSRMNVGQVFEALMGLAGTYLSQHFKLIPFDERYGVEASQSLVYLKLYQARLQSGQNWLFQVDFPGKTRLIDGRSGESFHQWITVGKAYILKLIHMVNEKIHARATGPYALITQQPLRGRSQKGGQRLGEMEVWALEGFGAAYILQELLTKKSDDMVGRKEVASAILPRPISIRESIEAMNTQNHNQNRFLLGQSEIFKVLMCELQALCLDVGVYSLTTQSFQRSFLSSVHEDVSS